MCSLKLDLLFQDGKVYSASPGDMIRYLGGFPCMKVGQRPYREIGLNRRKIYDGNYLDTYLRNDETDAWAESPLIEKKLIFLYT
jgi:hypothetical protein